MPTPNTLDLQNLPCQPGVYKFFDKQSKLLYVGKAKHLKNRVNQYFNRRHSCPKTLKLVAHIFKLEYIITNNETEALLLESNLIRHHKPPFNIKLKDRNVYPYITISNHEYYPSLFVSWKKSKNFAKQFGPFVSRRAAYELSDLLLELMKLRSCTDHVMHNRSRPCILFEIGKCSAPCTKPNQPTAYAARVQQVIQFLKGDPELLHRFCLEKMKQHAASRTFEKAAFYRDKIKHIDKLYRPQSVSLGKGAFDVFGIAESGEDACVSIIIVRDGQAMDHKNIPIKRPLDQEISKCLILAMQSFYLSSDQQFNQWQRPKHILVSHLHDDQSTLVNFLNQSMKTKITLLQPKLGEKRALIEMALRNANDALNLKVRHFLAPIFHDSSLKISLKLQNIPNQIECFDISHFQGKNTVGSCVVFDKNGARKRAYRTYNVSPKVLCDDYEALYLTLQKRFKNYLISDLPDLILIDGGIGQLNVAKKAFEDIGLHINHRIFSISKGPARKAGEEILHFSHNQSLQLPHTSKAMHRLQAIRDEAHRFAITRQRKKQKKLSLKSLLEEIPGIGPKKRQALMDYFIDLTSIKQASIKDLQKVHGISSKIAHVIFHFFKN